MERDVFTQRFHEASASARDFARHFIEEPLPDPLLFRLRLNASYDGGRLHEDERLFPEDSSAELARRFSRCTGDDVVNTLWRDGIVPEWVNVHVIGEVGAATLVEVLACGRFTANERLLYHQREGRAPFHVLGPAAPIEFEEGTKFSIYHHSECWSRDELERAAGHARSVWSLELQGDDFSDDVIAALPVLERMNVLELKRSPLTGPGLAGLNKQPALRHLRIDRSHDRAFSARDLPNLRRLKSFTIENLPSGPWGFSAVAALGVAALSITTTHDLVLDAQLRGPLSSLTLHARSIEGDPLPETVVSLHLQVRDIRDDDVARLLARVKAVTHLVLRGTPVSEQLVESFASRWKLEYLDVTDTGVGGDWVRRLRARYPKLRIQSNPDSKELEGDS